MRADIDQRGEVLARAQKVHGLIAKSRKGREAAQDANKHKSARLGGKDAMRLGQVREKANDKATNDIHCQRAIGERNAFGDLLNIAADEIPQNRTDKPTEPNDEQFAHSHVSSLSE